MYDFLKKIPLFSSLPDEDLERLCEMVTEVSLPAGAELFNEGSPGDTAYVIQEGEIEIIKTSGGRMVLLAVRKSGEVIGEMSLLEAAPRFATGRARTDSLLLAIGHSQLNHLLNTSPSAARAMLFTVTSRLRTTELLLRDSEKMAQLGTFTAGIAHELNNPAAAVQRGSGQLFELMEQLRERQIALDKVDLTGKQREKISQLEKDIVSLAKKPIEIDPLSRSDKEYDLETWLDENAIDNAWELAPVLVNLNYGLDQLDDFAKEFSAQKLAVIIPWLGSSYTVYSLLAEINQGAERISEIVKSLKSYVYLDQAPIQSIDVHEGLDNTLVMLRHKLKSGINVKRDYAPELPRIQAYGSELNQVWTNIIDNAIDAMNGKGEIILRTRQEGEWIFVEIEDNGPGIPEDILDKIFSPFFTTKPVGKGTGLGLNISYNIIEKHGGEVKVQSQPGKTRFQICLPVNFEKVSSGENPISSMENPTEQALRRMLQMTHTIAVVGISNREEQPNYSVPAYLQEAGYRIIPVNPNLGEVLGEKAFPDLQSIPEPVDTVLIFRRSEAVPEIVDQAIKIGAKIVWMQEGVINETAAAMAKNAGLEVVMDTCMRATHKRLM